MPNDRRKILRAIAREGRHIKGSHARQVYLKAAVETGIVESNLSNPSGGDADSAGWRQERASLYADPTNIRAAARRFRQEFQQHYDPGEKSYDVAAQVQRPAAQYRGRYRDVAGQAKRVIASELGGDVKGSQPNTRQGSSVTSYKTTPGVDNSALRQQARLSYLDTPGDPHDKLLTLASSLSASQDVPGTRTKTITKTPGHQDTTGGNGVKPGGGYQGTAGVANAARKTAKEFGLTVSSAKRDTQSTATGGTSDHWKGKKNAYAYDLGNGAMEDDAKLRAAKAIARKYGVKFQKDSYASGGTFKAGGKKFRVQILYGSGVDHADHVHVGVERL